MLNTIAKRLPSAAPTHRYVTTCIAASRTFATSTRLPSSQSPKEEPHPEKATEQKAQDAATTKKSTKTQAQLDEELREKMMGISGDGGSAGVEYENGEPVAMKRSVKNNMFRYI